MVFDSNSSFVMTLTYCPPNTQNRTGKTVTLLTTKEKRGIWLLPVSQFEAFHSLSCKQPERYPRRWYIVHTRKSVREGTVCPLHANGTVYTYPQHLPLQCSRQLIRFVEVSNCQKQSVSDAFQDVVPPPCSRSDIFRSRLGVSEAVAKLHIFPELQYVFWKNLLEKLVCFGKMRIYATKKKMRVV